jgi:hypothetical protein
MHGLEVANSGMSSSVSAPENLPTFAFPRHSRRAPELPFPLRSLGEERRRCHTRSDLSGE